MDKRWRGTRDDDLRPLGGAVYAEKNYANALSDRELLEARLLALRHAGFGFAQVEDDVHRFEAFHGGVKYLSDAAAVLLEDGIALGFADLLEDDLLGHLGGDAAEGGGVFVEAEFAADFDFRSEFAGLLEGELVGLVFNLLGQLDYGFEDVRAKFARFGIELGAHVFGGFVELAGGEGDGVFDRRDDYGGIDAFFAAECLNRLM